MVTNPDSFVFLVVFHTFRHVVLHMFCPQPAKLSVRNAFQTISVGPCTRSVGKFTGNAPDRRDHASSYRFSNDLNSTVLRLRGWVA